MTAWFKSLEPIMQEKIKLAGVALFVVVFAPTLMYTLYHSFDYFLGGL